MIFKSEIGIVFIYSLGYQMMGWLFLGMAACGGTKGVKLIGLHNSGTIRSINLLGWGMSGITPEPPF